MTYAVLRPEQQGDEAVFREAFIAIRRRLLDGAGFDAATVDRLVNHQFELQRASYRTALPGSVWEAIVAGGTVVGRMVTDADDDRVLLVDIMIAPERQRRGYGSQALEQLIARAGERTLELNVDHGSPAEVWYRSYGFEDAGGGELQLHLVRRPRVAAMAHRGAST